MIQEVDVQKVELLLYNRYTVATYLSALKEFIGVKPALADLQALVLGWSKYARSTIIVKRSALSILLGILANEGRCEAGIIDRLMFPAGQAKKERRAATDEEVAKLVAAAYYLPRQEALIVILRDTGLRLGTVPQITFTDIDRPEFFFVSTKRERKLEVFISSDMRRAVKRIDRTQSMFVFGDYDSDNAGYKRLNRMFNALCDAADVKLTAHQIRHYFATRCSRAGMSLQQISKLMGHKKVETTMGYIDLQPTELAQAMAAMTGGTRG